MACSKSTMFQRPSVILLAFLIAVSCGSSFLVQGSPIPQDSKSLEEHLNNAAKTTDDFITRTTNTFTGKADPNTPRGLTHLELAAVIAAAVVLGFIAFCCIGYCLCECVKELICCICCCKCCRD